MFEDLKDGVLLCHLIEVLTGEALQVNKARISKRVHHISNLTTALSVLRRRGLDLVNNNPSDIADGNPRIILGLIWQIILHFQIEANVQLLKEWGFELEQASPSTSRTTSTGTSPVSKLHRLRIGRLKAPVENVVLRWVNAQLSDTYHIKITDMDRCWRDGIAFNALIHRAKPELVDMDQVRSAEPKENLEQAFRLAQDYLQIRPLLQVEDMLCDKPDKRSIITYVSQFIRSPSLMCPIAAGPMIDDRSLLLWIESTLLTLRNVSTSPVLDQYQTHLTLRKEYFDRRHAYLSLREKSTTLPRDEWNRIESGWKRIGELLIEQSHGFESELPASLSGLAKWLCTAEEIIRRPIDLRVDDAQQTYSRINETIEQHRMCFSDYPSRAERFQSVYLSRRCDNREIAGEFLEPLKTRLDAVSHEAPRRLQHLHHLKSYYRILAYTESLNQKLELWRSGDSASLVSRWIGEYKVIRNILAHISIQIFQKESEAAPDKKLRKYISHLKETTSETSDENYERTLKQCEESSAEVLEKFAEMRHYLESLLSYWREFESSLAKVEEKVNRSERQRRNLIDADANDLLRRAEHARDGIARMASANGRETAYTRLAELRHRMNALNRYSTGGRLVADVQMSGTRAAVSQLEKTSRIAIVSTRATTSAQPSALSQLQSWTEMAQQKLDKKVANLPQLDALKAEILECQEKAQKLESERKALLKMRGSSEQCITDFPKMHQAIQARVKLISTVLPLFSAFENNHNNVYNWININKGDPLKYEDKMDALNNMKFLVESLSREEYKTWIDTSDMSSRLAELLQHFQVSYCFTVVSVFKNHVKKANEKKIKEYTAVSERQPNKYVTEISTLLCDKEQLISKREQSWLDYEQTQRAVTEIDRKLQAHGVDTEQSQLLSTLWKQKEKAAESLQAINKECDSLEKQLQSEKHTIKWSSIASQLDIFIEKCSALREASLSKLRDESLDRITVFRRTVDRRLEGAEQRVKELSLVGEADLQVAAKVLKDIEQEAQHLSESERERLTRIIQQANEVIQIKMDLFARLQQFYDTLVAIKKENDTWNSISSTQVPHVRSRLDELLSHVETEHNPEANALCAQLESVQASFFQLECDRVKQKLRLLVTQLEKIKGLMTKRKDFLLKFEEFQEFVKNAEGNLLKCIRDASEGNQVDVQRITNEMNGVFDKIESLGRELTRCQDGANMAITDAEVTDTISRIRNLPVFALEVSSARIDYFLHSLGFDSSLLQHIEKFCGFNCLCAEKYLHQDKPTGSSDLFQQFAATASELQNSLVNIDQLEQNIKATQISSMLKLQARNEDEQKEISMIESLEKLADQLCDSEKEEANKIVNKLRTELTDRCERRKVIRESNVEKIIQQLKDEQDKMETFLQTEITEARLPLVEEFEVNEFIPWNKKLEKVKTINNEDERRRYQINEMSRWAFKIEQQISKLKNVSKKKKRQKEKLISKLPTFLNWLELVEEDIAHIESAPVEHDAKICEELFAIKEMCLARENVFKKLEKAKLPEPYSTDAELCCERFRVIFEKVSHLDVKFVPRVAVSHLPSTSMQSQVSLSSLSSSDLEENIGGESSLTEGEGHEFMEYPVSKISAAQICSVEDLTDLQQLFRDTDAELNGIAESLSALNADYARSLKPVSEAEHDIQTLQSLHARRQLLEDECEKLSSKLDEGDLAILRAFIHQAQSLKRPIEVSKILRYLQWQYKILQNERTTCFLAAKNPHTSRTEALRIYEGEYNVQHPLQEFLKELRDEIDDELALRANYESIKNKLDRLTGDVNRHPGRCAVSDMRYHLENVETQLALLRVQCSQARKYVEDSIEETSPASSPSSTPGRKRIVLMVSKTVTTIIQVVEDELRRSPTPMEEELLEFRTKLNEINESMEEGHENGNIDALIALAKKLDISLSKLLGRDFTKQPESELENSVEVAHEGRVQLEGILRALHREPSPPSDVPQYIERINVLITTVSVSFQPYYFFCVFFRGLQKNSRLLNRRKFLLKVLLISSNVYTFEEELNKEIKARDREKTEQIKQKAAEMVGEPENEREQPENVAQLHKNIAELDEKVMKGEEALADEEELKHSDDSALIADKLKAVEELEDSLVAALEQLNASDMDSLNEQDRKDAKKKREHSNWLLDRIRALREKLAPLLSSLRDWDNSKDALMNNNEALIAEARELVESYANNAKPYSSACNDLKKANELVERMKEAQQQLTDAKQRIRTTLPDCQNAVDLVDKLSSELDAAKSDVEHLLAPLTEDVNKQKQLLDEHEAISAKLNELGDSAVDRRTLVGDAESMELTEIKRELGGVRQQLNELQRKQEEPVRLVFNPEALRVDSLTNQLENIERLLSEKEEHLAAQLALVALTSTIAKETNQLRDAIENAQKTEDNANANSNELQNAVDELKRARPHLDALRDAYEQLEKSPDTDVIRAQMLDEQTKLAENYDAVERALEDRVDNLNRFNENAADIESRLSELDESVREQGAPSAEVELSSVDAIIERCSGLRPSLDELTESAQELTPLIEPASHADALNSRQREMDNTLKGLRDEVIRLKKERDSESTLFAAVADLEQTLKDAEVGFEQTEPSVNALELFIGEPLRTVADKMALIDGIQSDVVTPKTEQLRMDKEALKERYAELERRALKKLEEAKHEDELVADTLAKLESIRQEANAFAQKYTGPQELTTAVDDSKCLEALLEQLPDPSVINEIKDEQRQDQLTKLLDTTQSSIKDLLTPLEKDIVEEQDLLRDLRSILSDMTSIGDDVVAIDPESEPSEQLENATQLGDSLRQLKTKVEKLVKRLQSPENLVKRTPLSDDILGRVTQLQDALDDKKQKLKDRAKLHTLSPEITQITESVQRHADELDQLPLQPLDEQSATLQDLELKKQQLESLIEGIPAGAEGDELRERSYWQLGQLNDLLKRLAAVVGDKLAALAAYKATKDEVQAQLAAIEAPGEVRLDSDSIQAITDHVNELQEKLLNAEKLRNKLNSIPEEELDEAMLDEKRNILLAIEAAKQRIEDERNAAQQQLDDAIALEKMHGDAEQLTSDLEALIAEAERLLSDSEATPSMYSTSADAFVLPVENAEKVLKDAPKEDVKIMPLSALVGKAKEVHSALLHRANIWERFVAERDNANDQLEAMRGPLDEIESKPLRSSEEVMSDLNALKGASNELNKIRSIMAILQELSEQLDPLETSYADVRFFDVDVEQTQQQYEDLMSLIDNELHDENVLGESTEQLHHELLRLSDELKAALNHEQLDEILQHQLPALQAQYNLLKSKHDEAKQTRVHVDRSSEPSTDALARELESIAELTRQKITELAEAEKQEKIVMVRLELEKLSTEAPVEEQLINIEEQLRQLPTEDEETKALSERIQQIRADKEKHDAMEKSLEEKLANVSQRNDDLDTMLKPLMEAKRLRAEGKKQREPTEPIEEHIALLNDVVNELERDIAVQLDDIAQQSQQHEVQLPSLPRERERAEMMASECREMLNEKLREKENVAQLHKNIAELDEKVMKGEEALADEEE
ncbi:unnamed protein product, partial [Anisakis simplex]